MGTAGYQGIVRLQDIRREDGPWRPRIQAQGTIKPAAVRLGSGLYGVTRLDAATYLGSTTSGWTRAETGLVLAPVKWMSLGAGYAHGIEFGNAMFPADRLLIRNMGMLRADFDLGPTKFGVLFKRDFDRDKWYREYTASQIMGCLEVFVVSRQFPRSYQLGVTFRLEEFLNLMRSRKLDLRNRTTTRPAHDLHAH
jgi:hypothetical protein